MKGREKERGIEIYITLHKRGKKGSGKRKDDKLVSQSH